MIPSLVRTLFLLVVVGAVLYVLGTWILWMFGGGNQLQRTSSLLIVEPRGPVNVSLEGGGVQRAEDALKLYAGDKVSTGGSGHASIIFFDGTQVRFDQQTDVVLGESARGTKESSLDLTLDRGTLYVRTPSLTVFSGSVLRTIHTPSLSLTIPAGTDLSVSVAALSVFSSDALGVEVAVKGAAQPVVIGEGQMFKLPANAKTDGNLYAYRAPLSANGDDAFVSESQTKGAVGISQSSQQSVAADVLVVTQPESNAMMQSGTVTVTGKIGKGVTRVRVNGFPAVVDTTQGTFSQELALKNEEQTEIHVEALDEKGMVMRDDRRIVRRTLKAMEPPAITAPAKSGDTYRTGRAEFEIQGTATADAAGIIVNDYRLQLYKAGSRSWSYLASTQLGNLAFGKNVYSVVAVDAAGNRSTPVTITIVLEEGAPDEVVVSGGASSAAASAAPAEMPNNAPLKPGSLTVDGPTAGASHTATGSEIVIYGTTPADTASVWVNDYRLQLYKPGKTTWNYIASVDFKNMAKGKNVYKIVVRNSKNEIIDTLEYTVTY